MMVNKNVALLYFGFCNRYWVRGDRFVGRDACVLHVFLSA